MPAVAGFDRVPAMEPVPVARETVTVLMALVTRFWNASSMRTENAVQGAPAVSEALGAGLKTRLAGAAGSTVTEVLLMGERDLIPQLIQK